MQAATRRLTSLLVIGLILLGIGAGAWWWSGRAERALASAEQALSDGEPDSALAELDLPERVPATRDRALIVHARAALTLKRVSEAARVLDQVDQRGPLATELGFWRGRTLYEAGVLPRAVSWFRWVLERRPTDQEAHRWLAAAAYDLGDHPTAVAALEAVTRFDPSDARAWRTLGLLYKEDVEYERAEQAYATSLKADPAQPKVRLERAEALMKLGRFAEAELELTACKNKVPEADRADLLAQCLLLQGDDVTSRAILDRALAAAPAHPSLLGQRAQIDLADGLPAEALARLDRAVAADPYNSQRIYQRGTALRALGRVDESERDFARAGELNRALAEMSALNGKAAERPEDADVRCQIGRLCLELGKTALAASWFRAALACDPHHPGARLALQSLGAPSFILP
jgi:tetratricopeptide (TPR) repeat protein